MKSKQIHYYDIISKEEITLSIVKKREKIGLRATVGVWMTYEKYKKLKEKKE